MIHPRILAVVFFLAALAFSQAGSTGQPGALIVVGGGGTPEEVVARSILLAGGRASVVAVLPQASERENRGVGSVQMFRDAGAGEVLLLRELDSPATRVGLARATMVWMPGGSQNKLMEAIDAAQLGDELREMHQRGVAFGGTSAGAAVQSKLMITGDAKMKSVVAGGTQLANGLGLWSEVIVDQHAIRRQRFHRLLSAVLDHPSRVGVAVDEQTAVVVQGARFEVLGKSSVFVVDARGARVEATKEGEPFAARGLGLHLLRAGMEFDLKDED